MNIFKHIYYYLFPNWKVIKALRGEWTDGPNTVTWSICVFEIKYSKRLNKYKLVLSGNSPKKHPMYDIAIKYLNTFENELQKEN